MSSRSNAMTVPTKESNRVQVADMKTHISSSPVAVKPNGLTGKIVNKATSKEMPTSPTPQVAPQCPQRDELLGSLTTVQQQRTSARVIKKLRLDDAAADRDKKDITECESVKIEDEKHAVKQRMPKAVWLSDEKDLFFEALNEFGKDFDAITSYICAKMKKKRVSDANLKNKHQVSHFYYRTWHKLSKYVHFDDNVKKVAQELYSLINYGELRKKCLNLSEKACMKLDEMVAKGSIVVRLKGRNLRVRTPMCRALRRLNQIAERSSGMRTCTRTSIVLHARDEYAWTRVQSAAHNPRLTALLPLGTLLSTFISALSTRWGCEIKNVPAKEMKEDSNADEGGKEDDDDGLKVQIDKTVKNNKLTLHVGPRANAEIHLPTISPCEQLSNQKICFTSYLERMGSNKEDCPPKIRTPKRQRKDSTNEKEKEDQKKIKIDEPEHKLMDIDETAIDGIELMASITETKIQEEEKTTIDVEDNVLEEDREERDKEKETERENYSFSEMEDDEKYNKSDTDNESDRCDKKSHKDRKFKNLKVKFRIRPKKQGGSIYTLVTDTKENTEEGNKITEELPKVIEDLPKTNEFQVKTETAEDKPDLDVENVIKQIRTGWSIHDAGQLTIGDLYLMFGSRSRIELNYWWAEPSQPICNLASKIKSENIKVDKVSPEKENDDAEKLRESDNEMLSPKNVFQDSNDGLSGDERKVELSISPEYKGQPLRIADKLVNKVRDTTTNYRSVMSDRLRRLVSLASSINPRCTCSQTCHIHRRRPNNEKQQCTIGGEFQLFRHPTPIAPKTDVPDVRAINMTDVPRWKRGRPRNGTKSSVVVQRLLPILPKQSEPSNNLIPVKLVSNPPKILPKPPTTSASGESPGSYVGRCDEKYLVTPGMSTNNADNPVILTADSISDANANRDASKFAKEDTRDNLSSLLGSESLSLTPSQLLRTPSTSERDAWFGDQDFSLSSFLAHLEHKPNDMGVDSQVHSLLTETSVDYVAKFADLAAELSADNDKSNSN